MDAEYQILANALSSTACENRLLEQRQCLIQTLDSPLHCALSSMFKRFHTDALSTVAALHHLSRNPARFRPCHGSVRQPVTTKNWVRCGAIPYGRVLLLVHWFSPSLFFQHFTIFLVYSSTIPSTLYVWLKRGGQLDELWRQFRVRAMQ